VEKKDYNGWENRQTWNVALWVNNNEFLYRSAIEFMGRYKGRAPYTMFIYELGMRDDRTPDNIAWLSTRLDYRALNSMMKELVNA
jgi:hypothetical protein